MTAYYNEIDTYAAAWLRNLIAAGHIAPGDVDERDIRDIVPADLAGYTQCHFFAGIGGWSYALRLAGWPDDRPVWTGSCPCQPFSAAGRAGGFADERHLWPAFFHLIGECRPPVVFGEQVASKDGLGWFDLVHADLEGANYAVGAADLCAAGVGAPHIRQRLWFVADANGWHARAEREHGQQPEDGVASIGLAEPAPERSPPWPREQGLQHGAKQPERQSVPSLLADRLGPGLEGRDARPLGHECATTERGGEAGGLGHAERERAGWNAGAGAEAEGGSFLRAERHDARPSGAACGGGLGFSNSPGSQPGRQAAEAVGHGGSALATGGWGDCEWVACRDGKWRPIEPGTFPLAHGVRNRVGRLRAYGNAIVPQVAAEFIGAYLDSRNAGLIVEDRER